MITITVIQTTTVQKGGAFMETYKHNMSILENQKVARRPTQNFRQKSGFSSKAVAASLCGLLAVASAVYAGKSIAESLPVSNQSSIEQRVESDSRPVVQSVSHKKYDLSTVSKGNVTFDLEGKLYSFKDMSGSSRYSKSVPQSSLIDMIIVEWAGTRNATYEGVKTKYDFGTMYMINAETKTCYKKVQVVGGVYDQAGNPSSPHNLKMIAGMGVDNPEYAKKGLAGGDPRNPFGDGLVVLYDVDQKYSVDQLIRAVDKGNLGFPSMHDQRQIHGKASSVSGLGYTIGCMRVDNPDIRYLLDNKDSALLVYFKN